MTSVSIGSPTSNEKHILSYHSYHSSVFLDDAQATGVPTPVVLPEFLPDNKTLADAWLQALAAPSAQV